MSSNNEPRRAEGAEQLPRVVDQDGEVVTPEGMTLSRRRLLQGIGSAAALVATGVVPALLTQPSLVVASEGGEGGEGGEQKSASEHFAEENQPVNYPGKPVWYADPPGEQKWAMVIDVSACIGCRRCVHACIKENNIGRNSGFGYIQVLEMERGSEEMEHATLHYEKGGNPDKWYAPIQCMHCAKPTCVYGCPVKATWKEPDGTVVIDYHKCICCKNCLVTCPYDARHINWVIPEVPDDERNPDVPLEDKIGVVEKCTFCVHRTRNGETTRCVEACPVGARTFGDLNDPDSEVSILLRTKQVFRFKEELGNEPMIWYVG